MTPKDGNYSEDALIERPAIELLGTLGWSKQKFSMFHFCTYCQE